MGSRRHTGVAARCCGRSGGSQRGSRGPHGGDVAYDLCYREHIDNQVDIILEGDEAAARSITFVEVPAEGDYLPLYNRGSPGPEPFPDARYTAPGPPDLEPVIIALDDPMRVSNGSN